MTMPKIDLHTRLPHKPKLTIEFLAPNNVKFQCENFPQEMKLTCVNILGNGAAVFIVEPVPSKILKPIMQS